MKEKGHERKRLETAECRYRSCNRAIYGRVIQDLRVVMQASEKSAREQVFDVKETLEHGLQEARLIFDFVNFSRTHANAILMSLAVNDLLTEQDLAGFSEETRSRIARWFEDPL